MSKRMTENVRLKVHRDSTEGKSAALSPHGRGSPKATAKSISISF